MRGRAVLEGVHQEAEALLRLLGREAQQFEHLLLQLRVVDTDRTAADLRAVADEVVGVGAHAARVAVEVLHILELGRGEGVVHGVVTLRFVVPLEQREVHHPQRGELLRVAQPQLLGHFEAQGAQLRQRLELLAAEDEDHVPGHSAAALGHGAHLLGGVELVDRRLHAVLRDANPDEALGADLLPLDELRQRVDLLAGVRGTARGGESGDVFGLVEYAEAVPLGEVGDLRELHAEAQVGFVRTVFLHRFDPRHAAQRLGQLDSHDVFEHVLGPALEDFEHVLLLDERHFAVDLRELGLAVGAQVLVAEAAHDLEILVVAGDHQQLLERLRRLGQGVELVGRHAARHDEVARSFGRRTHQAGGFDLEESLVGEEAADLLGHLVAQNHVALQGRTPQVEVAVLHAQVVAAVRDLFDGEGGHFGFVQDGHLLGRDLDVARRHFGVFRLPLDDFADDLDDPFAAHAADRFARLGGGVFLDDDLGDAVAVPQVDEGHGAEVPHFLHPSGQGDGLVDVAGPEAAAGMGSVHGDMLCLVVTIRKVN